MASQKARAALANLCLLRLRQLGGRATARQIADDLNKAVEFIQPRFSDLCDAKLIRDTGERVKGQRGRPQVIWEDVETTPPVPIYAGVIYREVPDWFSKYGN
jgi:hypothetical protein